MDKYFWDTQLEYLKTTRTQFWNDDYFEFLVKAVWKINKPVSIIDFGCGYGYLGLKLLPLLPSGSTYTGIDKSKELLNEAKRIFENSPYQCQFIRADLTDYIPEEIYDIAICQAVLRHIPNSELVLQKMVNAVVPSGRVICIEVNRAMEEAGFYLHDSQHSEIETLASLSDHWNRELNTTGRDYRMGIKIPILELNRWRGGARNRKPLQNTKICRKSRLSCKITMQSAANIFTGECHNDKQSISQKARRRHAASGLIRAHSEELPDSCRQIPCVYKASGRTA